MPQDIYASMDARRAPIRANREKPLLSHVFRYTIRWGCAAANPCQLVSSNREWPRSRYVEDSELQTVYDLPSSYPSRYGAGIHQGTASGGHSELAVAESY